MGRRKRMVAARQPRKASPVVVYRSNEPRPSGWSLQQAADLVRQGYTDAYIKARTGIDPRTIHKYRSNRRAS